MLSGYRNHCLIRQVVSGSIGRWRTMPNHLPPAPQRFLRHQESLPHLPVPPLQQTLQKYLDAVRPIVDDSQFSRTKGLVVEFGKKDGLGPKLQEKLELRARNTENWMSEWWLNAAYLDYRDSVVINVSPAVTFPRYDFRGQQGQVEHAAKLISAVLDYKIDIDNETLAVEKLGNHPLCMDQYYKILSACRVPGEKKDEVEVYARSWRPPQHIVVVKNNHFFKLDVYNSDGSPLTIEQLEIQLQKIVEASQRQGPAIGILSSDHRDNWGKVAKDLMEDATNINSMRTIQRSIFMVCLDEATPVPTDDRWTAEMALRVLHGGGSKKNSANRWFDKTLQFVICPDGGMGILYEHSLAEGPPIVALLDHVYKYCENLPEQPKSPLLALSQPKKLDFKFSSDVERAIQVASDRLDAAACDIQIECLRFIEFGKNFPKSSKMSPDAFIQIALQVTYMNMYKKSCATYESASTRRFRLGRTDTIRSCSNASKALAVAMLDGSSSSTKVAELLREAVKYHRKYTNEAISGQVIDRHLLGLKLAALEMEMDVPEIFQDSSYKSSMHFNLSTSQVPCKADLSMGFGPAVLDGYGICYNPKEDHILFSISAHKSCPETDAALFSLKLQEALLSMQSILQKADSLSSKL